MVFRGKPKIEQPIGGEHGVVVMDTDGNRVGRKLCEDKDPGPRLTRCDAGGHRAAGGDTRAAASQSPVQEGDEGVGQILPLPPMSGRATASSNLGHVSLGVGMGGKAPGAHHS